MATTIPLWATSIVAVVALTVATLVWLGISRVSRSLFDTTKTRRIAITTAAVLAIWLLSSVLIGTVLRPSINRSDANLLLGWITLLITIGYGLRFVSPTFRQIVEAIPQPWLIGVQFYRNLGAIFLPLMILGLLPPFFAIPAGVGDLLSGLPAPLVAYWYARNIPGARAAAIFLNIAGMLDFIIALGTGTSLLAGPAQAIFGTSAISTAPLPLWPLVMLPTFVVPLGLMLHLHSLTNLMRRRNPILELAAATHNI